MKVGKLRNVVQIQRNVGSERSSIGEITDAWTTLNTVRAQITPLAGRETWEGSQTQGIITHDITMRATDVTNDDRLVDQDGRIYEVVSVFVDNNINHVYIIKCKEKNSNETPQG